MPNPNVIPIDDLNDSRIDPYRDVRDKDLRGRDSLFMGESDLVVRRLLRTPERLHSLFLSPPRLEALRAELAQLPESVPVYVAPVDLMTSVAGFHIHRGVLAVGFRPRPFELDAKLLHEQLIRPGPLRIVVAEGLTNVDNIGAIFRNAAAFGAHAVLLDPECCDPLYRKAIRVSMGHVLRIPWGVCRRWPEDLIGFCDGLGVTLLGAELDDRSRPPWQEPWPERVAIVLGSEANGLSPEVRECCAGLIEIPMQPGVASLNVAVTSAILLYEMQRDARS